MNNKNICKRNILLLVIMVLFLGISGVQDVNGAVGRIVNVASPYSYNEMEKDISGLLEKYPQMKADIIGQTKEGRYIYSLHLGKGKKVIQLNGAHHGREWITSLLIMQMVEDYAEAYHKGSKYKGYDVKRLLDQVSITIIPMVNPDGVQIAQYGLTISQKQYFSKLWGQNPLPWKRWKANGMGIDPNSNYNALWKYKKTKPRPYAWDFKGYKPETAEEVAAMVKDTKQKKYAMVLSFHSAGRIIFWNDLQKGKRLKRDKRLAKEISKITGYSLVKPTKKKSVYAGYKDWFIMTYKKPGFTIEVGKANKGKSVPIREYNDIYNQNRVLGLWAAQGTIKLKLPSLNYRPINILKIDGQELITQTPPYVIKNKVYISIKDLAKVINGDLSLDLINNKVVIVKGNLIIEVDSRLGKINVNGQMYNYDSKKIYNTIMIDSGFLRGVLGYSEMKWDKVNSVLNIISPQAN